MTRARRPDQGPGARPRLRTHPTSRRRALPETAGGAEPGRRPCCCRMSAPGHSGAGRNPADRIDPDGARDPALGLGRAQAGLVAFRVRAVFPQTIPDLIRPAGNQEPVGPAGSRSWSAGRAYRRRESIGFSASPNQLAGLDRRLSIDAGPGTRVSRMHVYQPNSARVWNPLARTPFVPGAARAAETEGGASRDGGHRRA